MLSPDTRGACHALLCLILRRICSQDSPSVLPKGGPVLGDSDG